MRAFLDPLCVTPYIAVRFEPLEVAESLKICFGGLMYLLKVMRGLRVGKISTSCFSALVSLFMFCLFASGSVTAAEDTFEPKFPKTMSWSAYNLGTTGYNQAVAIGKALKDNYGVNLRVLPGKNDVSRLLPLQLGLVQFSANGVATYF